MIWPLIIRGDPLSKKQQTSGMWHQEIPSRLGGSLGPLAIGDLVEGWIEGFENYAVSWLQEKLKKQKHGCRLGKL